MRLLVTVLVGLLLASCTTPPKDPGPCYAQNVAKFSSKETGRRIVFKRGQLKATPSALSTKQTMLSELKGAVVGAEMIEGLNALVYTPAPGANISLMQSALDTGWEDVPEIEYSITQTTCQKCVRIDCPPENPTTPNPTPTPTPTPITDRVPYGVAMVRGVEAQSVVGATAQSQQTVCVLDTGVNASHPDLAGRLVAGRSFVGGDTTDRQGHGTHVMGTVLAAANNSGIVGVAGHVKGRAVKVLGDNGSGSSQGIAQGIVYAADNGCQVINMSLGSDMRDSFMDQSIAYARSKGVYVVVAAGNSGRQMTGSPSLTPGVIAVTAVDSAGRPASFTSYGPTAAWYAPGVNVESLSHVGSGYTTMSGTSMASPHVAGIVALMLSAGKTTVKGRSLGLSSQYGAGLADALLTVQ